MRDWKFKTFVSWTLCILCAAVFTLNYKIGIGYTEPKELILVAMTIFWAGISWYYLGTGIIWQEKEDKK